MKETFFEKWRHRFAAAWDVLTGRAWAGYGDPADWEYIGDCRSRGDESALEDKP